MEFMDVLEKRKSYRAFDPVEITDEMVKDLAYAASRAPSCSNNQPWRFVFVKGEKKLNEIKKTLNKGNYWGERGSLIVAVFSKGDLDCQVRGRDYNWLDTGMAMMNLLLKAVDMGLATHPIAGFDEVEAKEVLNIPEEYTLLPLIIISKRSDDLSVLTKDWQIEGENKRSERRPLEEIYWIDEFDLKE